MVSLQQLCHRYSGVWEGSSLSNSGDPTAWSNTLLVFRPRVDRRFVDSRADGKEEDGGSDAFGDYDAAATTLAVEGRGVSRWRDMRIFFLASGDVDLVSGRFTLRKQHTGAYTNRVEYHGELDLRPDARKGPPLLQGVYSSGRIELRRHGGCVRLLESLISGRWTGRSQSAQDTPAEEQARGATAQSRRHISKSCE